MFKNREVKITVNKKDKGPQTAEETIIDAKDWKDKTDYALSKLQSFGKMVALSVCAYVILDTARQVTVEKAKADH